MVMSQVGVISQCWPQMSFLKSYSHNISQRRMFTYFLNLRITYTQWRAQFFKHLFYLIWKIVTDRGRDLPYSSSLSKSFNNGNLARPKSGARNSILVSHLKDRYTERGGETHIHRREKKRNRVTGWKRENLWISTIVGVDQAEAWSFISLPHWCKGPINLLVSQAHQMRVRSEVEQQGVEPVPVYDTSVIVGGFTKPLCLLDHLSLLSEMH